MLERKHGLRVVIAAHPKAKYSASTFEGREAHRLITAELVKDAEYVICHLSTAVSYAVLNMKPLVFIYTDDMARTYRTNLMRSIRRCAAYLGAPVYNIDSVRHGQDIVVQGPEIARYARYKYDFLTTPQSESSANGAILWRELGAC